MSESYRIDKQYFMQIVSMLIISIGIAGCGFTQKSPEYTDPSEAINTKVGSRFIILLDSNRTTGYQWQLAERLDSSVLQAESSEYILPEKKLIGAGGKEKWTFKTVGKGKTTASFEYLRSWEKDVNPARVSKFTIIVR